MRGGARSQMRTCLRKRQRSLTGKNTANFAIVGRRAGLAEAKSADLWAHLRQFPEMKSSDLIRAKAAIMRIFAAICLCV